MSNLKSERGAVLVVTLMVITLLMLFILAQFSQVSNTTKQVATMEENIDAQLIADMGVEYYYQLVMNYHDKQRPVSSLKDFVAHLPENVPEVAIDNNHSFKITQLQTEPEVITNETATITIIYTSEGKAFRAVETKEGQITINLEH
ncbi:hypothetical protein ACFO3D_00510 [Virgibacillus kekensis]|uniref:Type II secretory pathway, pseudopilin PulG n=1 Tax=Virgibacillus kekensis TaxID=202261 RepID=A0ABV9DED3_9BACI